MGAMDLHDKGRSPVRISKPEETKRALIHVIDSGPRDVDRVLALLYLRGSPRDYVRWFFYCVEIRIWKHG